MEFALKKTHEIKVANGLDRYRTDMGELKELADSFKRTRQIQPIIINKNNELIAGGRRLAACVIAGIDVKCVYEDTLDPYQMRELEIEENLCRKNYTPAEYALAVRDLHQMKVERFGEGGKGRKQDGDKTWSAADTAKVIGKTKATVYNALEMADLVDKFPVLKQAKKKSEIKKAAKSLEKLNKTVEGLSKNKEVTESGDQLFKLVPGDAVEFMLNQEKDSVDIILTDPLFGIEADKLMQSIGGNTGGVFSSSGYKIDDSTDKAMLFYKILAKESFRFTKDTAQGFVFVGPEYFWTLRKVFMDAGWNVYVKPIIWIKREVGQCNIPAYWPSSCYEMLMFIRKQNARLVIEGKPDWLECDPVLPSKRIHPYEKPVQLLINLLQRISLPGHLLVDPFMGSGSTIEAATKLKIRSIGVEIDSNAYATSIERMKNVISKVH